MDPDWNPANDNQSIDRCYRIGTKKDVIVYRLISSNSVEEQIYRRQVFKSSLSKATVDDGHDVMMRYFDDNEFEDLLQFDYNKQGCETINIIDKKHGKDGSLELHNTETLNTHVPFLKDLDVVDGITNHG